MLAVCMTPLEVNQYQTAWFVVFICLIVAITILAYDTFRYQPPKEGQD